MHPPQAMICTGAHREKSTGSAVPQDSVQNIIKMGGYRDWNVITFYMPAEIKIVTKKYDLS